MNSRQLTTTLGIVQDRGKKKQEKKSFNPSCMGSNSSFATHEFPLLCINYFTSLSLNSDIWKSVQDGHKNWKSHR